MLFCTKLGGEFCEFSSLAVFQAEVEETLKRIQTHKGVIGTIVVNAEGNTPICFPLYLINHY